MAAITLYYRNGVVIGSSTFTSMQQGAYVVAATFGEGWAAQTKAAGQFAPVGGPFTEIAFGSGLWTSSTLPSTAAPDDSAGDSFRSDLPYYGEFANDDWTFNVTLRSVSTSWNGRCRINFRLFRGSDPTGAGATEITSGVVSTAATTENLSTTIDRTIQGTWSPGSTFTFNGEFLFAKVAVEITQAGTNSGNIRIRSGSGLSNIVTPDFTQHSDAKQFYFKNAGPSGATNFRSLQDGGSISPSATSGTGWNAGTHANTDYCLMNGAVEIPTADGQWTTTVSPDGTGPDSTKGDCWRSENALTGTFDTLPWGFNFGFRSITANYTGRYRIKLRVWKSPNQDGSSATELTTAAVDCNATVSSNATGVSIISAANWTPGSPVTMSNDYLFVQVAIDITSAGGGSSHDILFYLGSAEWMGVVTPKLVVAGGFTHYPNMLGFPT